MRANLLTEPAAHGIRGGVRSKAFAVVLAVSVLSGALIVAASTGSAEAASDGESAESLLKTLEANPVEAAATADTRKRARTAIERARRFRESGDDARARIADGLALRAAELARDQARTLRAERATADSLRAAEDAGAQVDRERALVEEAIAQAGRLRAQLEALELERKREPERTAPRVLNDAGVTPANPAPKAAAKDGGAR